MKIAVTGAGGFIGSRITAELSRRGHDVTSLQRPRLDMRRAGSFGELVRGHEVVVHAAAHVPRVHDDPAEAQPCLEVNAVGTLALLTACRDAGVARFVLLSGGNLYRPGPASLAEDAPIDPSHRAVYYLTSKACGDFYASHFERELGYPVCILRPSAVYGPGLARGMIRTFTDRLLAGSPITVDDGGRYEADFVEVDDVARATAEAIARAVRGPLNIGGGVTTSALSIAKLLAELTGVAHELVQVAPPRGGQPGFSALDITRARGAIDYAPCDIREGLARFVAWRRSEA